MRYSYSNGHDYTDSKIVALVVACIMIGIMLYETFGDPLTNYTNCRRNQRIELRRRQEADDEQDLELETYSN